MNTDSSDFILPFTLNLAQRAGEVIVLERTSPTLSQKYKNGSELVTSADLKSDQLIREEIQRQFPSHRILSEESSPDLKDWPKGPLWIIDPIDGTVNYAYGQKQTAISIAYAVDGQVQVGVVHVPFENETFSAVRGKGALLNGQPIHPSGQTDLRRSLIGTGFPYDRKDTIDGLMKRLRAVLLHCRDIRRVGSAAIDTCWVAMGRLDGYYETVMPWDIAAAGLIASEAGARRGNFSELPPGIPADVNGKDVLITTPAIYSTLLELLK